MHYVLLCIAIVAEVIATSALKATNGFTKFAPSVLVIAGYGLAFYLLSIVVKTLPVGVVYAIWSGAGIVLVAIAGFVWLNQKLDLAAIIGIGLILAGVAAMNLFSNVLPH